mmetsp:Transcript_18146/g.58668  ORF Transcript_18146/g.58668 Transcript_18146/m.58668 type:complete len:100 (-) Transcript_18146:343-642(-)
MGGSSRSYIHLVNLGDGRVMQFFGDVTDIGGGGFVSCRTKNVDPPYDFSHYSGIVLNVRGDGNRFKFVLHDHPEWFHPLSTTWETTFDTVKDKWIAVDM